MRTFISPKGGTLKAQASAEFLVVVSALFLIFLIFYTVYFGQSINLAQSQDSLTATRNAYALAAALNYVHLAGDGADYNFTLSGKGSDENITISGLAVGSNRALASGYAPLLSGRTNTTSVQGGEMVIKNKEGAIEIEQ